MPPDFSMLTIGACAVDDPGKTFSCRLKPISPKFEPKAMEVTGLSLEELERTGLEPADAMRRFAEWAQGLAGAGERFVFVGLNAPFYWSFVNFCFHRFGVANPFGFTALDVKALYMGATGCDWDETRSSLMDARLKPALRGDHDALGDALYQAEIFRLVRDRLLSGGR